MISLLPSPAATSPHPSRRLFDATAGGTPCISEPELRPRPLRLCSVVDQLRTAPSAEERQRRVADIVQAMGFDWLGYARVQVAGETVLPVSFCTTHGDAAWQRRYVAESYQQVDPRLRMALRTSLPRVWHLDELTARTEPAAPAERDRLQRFLDDLRATGMRCGVVVALPSAQPHERVIVSLMSREAAGACADDDLLFGRVLTLGVSLHEYHTHHAASADDAAPPVIRLSSTQRAILQCLARGLADKQIADRLDLSPHAVDYHMRQLRKRFGARNRLQLVPQALRQSRPM